MRRQVITISRELGSGGRLIGKKVAEILGWPLYDSKIIDQTAKISGFANESILSAEEKVTNSFLYNIAMGTGYGLGILTGTTREAMPLNAQVYLAQREAIQELAQKGSCVIVGRCADYILKDEADVLRCFIYADIQNRIERAVNEYGMDKKDIEKKITQADKSRAVYYNSVTDQRWGDRKNYDVMINSGCIDIDGSAEFIASIAERRQKK